MGTGPYRFKEMKSGEKIVFVANPDYFKGPAAHLADRLPGHPQPGHDLPRGQGQGRRRRQTHRAAVQATDRVSRLREGLQQVPLPRRRLHLPGLQPQGQALRRPSRAPAFAHAINKRELLDGVVLGLGREATGPIRPGTWADNPDVKSIPFDPKRAAALLAEAGWTRNGKGVLEKDGQRFAFELITNQGNDERKKVAEIIQASLRELGVQVEIRVLEWAALLKEHVKKRQFDAIVLGWGTGRIRTSTWSGTPRRMAPDQLNQISYANPEVDALLEAGPLVLHAGRPGQVLPPAARGPGRGPAARVPLLARRAAGGLQPHIRHPARSRPASAGTSSNGSCPGSCSGIPPGDRGPNCRALRSA